MTRTVRYLTEDQVRERAALAQAGRTRDPVRAEVLLMPAPETDEPDATVSGSTAVLRLYDVIDSWGGWWGISAAEVAETLDDLPDSVSLVEIHLNSPGGEATEGVALANVLRQHPARIVAIVDGLAASAASMVAMGADEVVVAPGSQLMVHEASGGAWGPADYMESMARSLHSISGAYAAAYAAKAGGTAEQWREVMRAETWFAPDEAVTAGLADRLLTAPATTEPAAAVARHDLRVFAHAGRQNAPAPRLPAAAPAARASTTTKAAVGGMTEEDIAMSEFLNGVRERLGLSDTADETAALAALDEALTERAEAPAAQATVPAGHTLLPDVALDELRAQAAQGAQAHEQLRLQNRAAALDSYRDRFTPVNRARWEAAYDRDPENTVELLKAMPVVVPTAEVGHGLDPKNELDDEFFALFPDEKKAV